MSEVDELLIETLEEQLAAAESRAGNLAADLLEERAQRREVGEALVRVTEERDGLQKQLEAMDKRRLQEIETLRVHGLAVSQKLRAEIERLRTIIVELGAGEAAEPEEQIEALRPGDAGFDEWLLGQPGGSE
jgi:flagellar biosynthesis/type III secretory pathway chaperone